MVEAPSNAIACQTENPQIKGITQRELDMATAEAELQNGHSSVAQKQVGLHLIESQSNVTKQRPNNRVQVQHGCRVINIYPLQVPNFNYLYIFYLSFFFYLFIYLSIFNFCFCRDRLHHVKNQCGGPSWRLV